MTDQATGASERPENPSAVGSPVQRPVRPHSAAGGVLCPYCGSEAKLVGGLAIYPHRPDLGGKKFWRCKPCDAYVGCHEAGNGQGDGTKPLGRLANAELRKAKKDAHYAFDRLWLDSPNRRRARGAAYAWLADAMGLTADECHIGEMDVQQCRQVFRLVVARKAAGTVA